MPKNLVDPCAGTKRVVCAESYYASVTAAEQLLPMMLRFIGVVKKETRGYRKSTLSVVPLEEQRENVAYTHTSAEGVAEMISVLWVDRERRYFIFSASCTLPGTPWDHVRRRQVSDHSERVFLTVPQPLVVETYYQYCTQIELHYRCRQDDFRREHKLVTHDFSSRVNRSLWGTCVANVCMLYAETRGEVAELTHNQFYEDLAAQLIPDTYEAIGLRQRGVPDGVAGSDGAPLRRLGVGDHPTPTLKRRKGDADHRAQRDCRVCRSGPTTLVCSSCRDVTGVDLIFVVPRHGGDVSTSTSGTCTKSMCQYFSIMLL